MREGLELAKAPKANGASGETVATLFELPAFACPDGHERKYFDNNFGPYFFETIFGKLPTSKKAGFRRSNVCLNCNGPLELTIRERSLFSLRFELAHMDPFVVNIALPTSKCQSCWTVQRTSSQTGDYDLSESLLNAFKSISLKR